MSSDARARKISATMRARGLDNFSVWRERMRMKGKFGTPDVPFPRSGDLAEFIGAVLGDGNISVFPRTERLIISCDSRKPGFVARYSLMTKQLFTKEPTVMKVNGVNNIRISLYQRGISRRLGVPSGNRGKITWWLPSWIRGNRNYLRRLLRGLYEAEGSLNVHLPTYTYKFLFANQNESLLNLVHDALRQFGFHPHRSPDKIQLSRRAEVEECVRLLKFRKYDII